MSGCTPACWTPVFCRECRRPLPPRGRSVAAESSAGYCDCKRQDPSPQHLWSVHDSDRFFFDRSGWEAHVSGCEECQR